MQRVVIGLWGVGVHIWAAACAGQGVVDLAPPPGEGFYGMAIESVVGNAERIRVTTTGAVYDLTKRGLALVRRIDPASNDIKPRLVAKLAFDRPIGRLEVVEADRRRCVISAQRVVLDFRSDSLVLMTCRDTNVKYVYRSLIKDAPWVKGTDGEWMWTDGYGGSLHARNPSTGGVRIVGERNGQVEVVLKGGAGVALAVFPPKAFDFERLYGAESRPHVWYAGNSSQDLDYAEAMFDELAAQRFGVMQFYAGHYDGVAKGEVTKIEYPVTVEGRLAYRFQDPERVRSFCRAAHAKGFKVICYMAGQFFSSQDLETTLAFMRSFQEAHGLDGWYFDNAAWGRNWLESYEFVRRVRQDVGDEGVLYHHDSVDVWAGMLRDGRVLVPLDAYMDYTLKGETGALAEQVHGPDDNYLRYYVSGYGLAQTIGFFKIASSRNAAITREDAFRVLGENLHGGGRTPNWGYRMFQRMFLPAHERHRRAYLSGRFDPDVRWPPRWYQQLSAVEVTEVGARHAVLSWRTPIATDSDVRYTDLEHGGLYDLSRDTLRHHRSMATKKHRVLLRGLKSGAAYRFAVRSSGLDAAKVMRVWGGMGRFATKAGVRSEK